MSICRYVDVIRCGDSHCSESQAPGWHSFHRNLLAVLRYGKERDLNSRVRHTSSRIQELSPDIHVPCYGHTGHTHYVSFFAGPSWWRYWETSRILCMMLSTLTCRTVIGDHHPILLEKTHLFATTTIIPLILVIWSHIPLLSSFWFTGKPPAVSFFCIKSTRPWLRTASWKHGWLQHLIWFGFPMKNPSYTSKSSNIT